MISGGIKENDNKFCYFLSCGDVLNIKHFNSMEDAVNYMINPIIFEEDLMNMLEIKINNLKEKIEKGMVKYE